MHYLLKCGSGSSPVQINWRESNLQFKCFLKNQSAEAATSSNNQLTAKVNVNFNDKSLFHPNPSLATSKSYSFVLIISHTSLGEVYPREFT
jgi:hypothetical protein